ncbi:hypothetical protein KFK09_026279 [Dendrobium nobile]|uniref:Uncharacterized protein n=1 Tax=Dendrobium nobile TaxID=94219 RepID=A0A8T3A7S3_DENNO|nr:hypothetical protein KFK09_026279 [Dendrobium nobile]
MNIGDNELYDVNMAVVNIDSSELNPFVASPVMPVDLIMSVSSVGIRVNKQLIDVQVPLLSANTLYAHVGVRSRKIVKAQIDSLEGNLSSPSNVDEEEVFKQDGGM